MFDKFAKGTSQKTLVSQSDIIAKSFPTVVAPIPGQCDMHHCNSNRFKQLSIMRDIVKTQCPQCSQHSGWKEHIKKILRLP
ncbi:hypothetical protein KM92DES2_11158 [uncultured Desulfovibrio sp.]|uniref:Uncharacterized protein n=1 Tax=uncultured Desulfovibrio sp. TaxID=167968 RepID=A0A212JI97_9BACT|nr:hypothetical protein KM92DES2_11158 [uncultured Desulfovibrio sp.]